MFFLQPRYKEQSGSDVFLMAAEKVTAVFGPLPASTLSTKDPGVEIGSNNIPAENTKGM